MSRYVQEVKLDQPIDVVSMIVEDYVYHHRFKRNDWNGEMVYYMKDKHGKERYMKWDYTNGVFHMEAWLKNAFGGEEDLKGFGSTASKNEFRKSLELLVSTIKRQKASAISSGHVGSDPLHHTDNHAAEHRAQRQGQQMSFGSMPGQNNSVRSTRNTSTVRGASRNTGNARDVGNLIYAILAIVFSSVPVMGLIMAISCLSRNKNSDSSSAKTVKIVCTVAIILSLLTLATTFLPAFLLPMSDLF